MWPCANNQFINQASCPSDRPQALSDEGLWPTPDLIVLMPDACGDIAKPKQDLRLCSPTIYMKLTSDQYSWTLPSPKDSPMAADPVTLGSGLSELRRIKYSHFYLDILKKKTVKCQTIPDNLHLKAQNVA